MAIKTRQREGVTDLAEALRGAWTRSTSTDPAGWSPDNPAWGQCAVTALVVQDALGGELLRARVNDISHYWNRLASGAEVDLTLEQFRSDVSFESPTEIRSRDYVLSFPDTVERYTRIRRRLEQH